MRKCLLISLVSFFYIIGNAQNKDKEKLANEFLTEFSDRACQCVDSIQTFNRTQEQKNQDIHSCLKKQVGPYQTTIKMLEATESVVIATEGSENKNIDINIYLDENSQEFKNYYFKIESYMMKNCESMEAIIKSRDVIREKSLSDNPEALEWYNKGMEVTKKENFKKAIEYYEKAIALDSNFAFAWDNIGICQRRLGNYEKALNAYKRSLEIDSMGAMPLQNIPVVYMYMKNYDEAIKAFKKLLIYDSKNPETYFGIGQIYYSINKDYESGLDYMCKAYNIYIEKKSPYRTDAETIIKAIYTEMKKQGKEDVFNSILQKNNISTK